MTGSNKSRRVGHPWKLFHPGNIGAWPRKQRARYRPRVSLADSRSLSSPLKRRRPYRRKCALIRWDKYQFTIEALQIVKIARDSAVKMRLTTIISLQTVLITALDELRCDLEKLTDHKLVVACSILEASEVVTNYDSASQRHTLAFPLCTRLVVTSLDLPNNDFRA